MNAKEFIQKFGWNDARVCILNCACPEDRWFMRHGDLVSDQDFDDLKRLVESYELVEKVGGLLSAKANINEMVVDSGSGYVSDGAKLYDYDFSFGSLRKAIADVESCMEVNQ